MKRVLVTGATGFIGQYVVKQLMLTGCHVVIAVREMDKAKLIFGNENLEYKFFDLNTPDEGVNYFEYFQKPDTLVHLAWEGLPNFKSEFHIKENLPRHLSFLDNMIRNGLKDIVVTGTCLEYGMIEGELDEDIPVQPTLSYAVAKHKLHEAIKDLSLQYRFNLKWLRLFYMWGDGQYEGSLIPQLKNAINEGKASFPMSGGEQVRDFLPVETMAEYIVCFALIEHISGCFNCCSGKPVTVKEFVEEYLKSKNCTIRLELGVYPYPDYEPMSFWGSTKKLNTIINQHESGRTV